MSKYYVTLKYRLNVAGIDHSAELWIDNNVADSASNQVSPLSLPGDYDFFLDLVAGYTARVPSKTNADHDPEHKEVMRQVLEMFPNASDIIITKEK
jgi:hypothetical protein